MPSPGTIQPGVIKEEDCVACILQFYLVKIFKVKKLPAPD